MHNTMGILGSSAIRRQLRMGGCNLDSVPGIAQNQEGTKEKKAISISYMFVCMTNCGGT